MKECVFCSAKFAVFFVFIGILPYAKAVNVEWNLAQVDDHCSVWDAQGVWELWGKGPTYLPIDVYFTVERESDALRLVKSNFFAAENKSLLARQSSAGDVVDQDAFANVGLFYEKHSGSRDVASDYDILIQDGESIYLSFSLGTAKYVSDESEYYNIYGWVEIGSSEDGVPVALGSAWDLDGGSVIVGAGGVPLPTPEPTSGLLLLVGLAALGLRRRSGSRLGADDIASC